MHARDAVSCVRLPHLFGRANPQAGFLQHLALNGLGFGLAWFDAPTEGMPKPRRAPFGQVALSQQKPPLPFDYRGDY
jgi:hypothetical protein